MMITSIRHSRLLSLMPPVQMCSLERLTRVCLDSQIGWINLGQRNLSPLKATELLCMAVWRVITTCADSILGTYFYVTSLTVAFSTSMNFSSHTIGIGELNLTLLTFATSHSTLFYIDP